MSEQTQSPLITLLRKPVVLKALGLSNSTFYERISKGEIPPGVSLGGRSVAWPDYEVKAVLTAIIAGKSQDEIKELVNQLVEQRTNPIN